MSGKMPETPRVRVGRVNVGRVPQQVGLNGNVRTVTYAPVTYPSWLIEKDTVLTDDAIQNTQYSAPAQCSPSPPEATSLPVTPLIRPTQKTEIGQFKIRNCFMACRAALDPPLT